MRSCSECGNYAEIIDYTTEYGWCFVMEDIPIVKQEGRHFFPLNCPFEDVFYLLGEYFK